MLYARKCKRPTGTTFESIFAEHMEEDDPTLRALPRWVELEYKVSINGLQHPPPRSFPNLGLTMNTNATDEPDSGSALWACNPHYPPPPSPPPRPLPQTRCNASTHRPSTCARSQDPMRPSPLRTSRAQRAPPSPPPSTHLIPHPHPPPARLLRPPMPLPLLPLSRVQSATNKAYYRSCKRATSRSTTYACSIPKRPRPSRHPTAARVVANSRGSSSALRALPFLPPFWAAYHHYHHSFFFFWF
jgi:hypothetical protein